MQTNYKKRWSEAEKKLLIENRHLGVSRLSEIFTPFGRTKVAIENYAHKHNISMGIWCKDPLMSLLNSKTIPSAEDLISEYERRGERQRIWNFFNTPKSKRIITAELHIPFHDKAIIKKILNEKGDILVLLGDTVDFYGLSRFRKDRYIPLKTELSLLASFLDEAIKRFEYVVMLEANHEQRFRKIILDKLQNYPQVIEQIQDQSLIGKLSKLYKTVFAVPSWWCKIHKVIFSHPDFFGKAPGSTVKDFYTTMEQEGERDFQAIFCGHTHHQIVMPYTRTYLYEVGIACKKVDYMFEGKKRLPEWHQGYGICSIDKNGNFQPNESKLVHCGWGD